MKFLTKLEAVLWMLTGFAFYLLTGYIFIMFFASLLGIIFALIFFGIGTVALGRAAKLFNRVA